MNSLKDAISEFVSSPRNIFYVLVSPQHEVYGRDIVKNAISSIGLIQEDVDLFSISLTAYEEACKYLSGYKDISYIQQHISRKFKSLIKEKLEKIDPRNDIVYVYNVSSAKASYVSESELIGSIISFNFKTVILLPQETEYASFLGYGTVFRLHRE